ncbi:MAG: thiamine pyrophosphate-binding protein [Acidimicrobiia bacterium]|nr:thiamine pyrophosphate-binding protein [Acidimicrobiia bacterium]
MASRTGGAIVAQMLAAEGVDTVFGIIDGTYFGLISSLEDAGIRLISPRHETSALHMAGTYARITGRLGVAIASNGPGVANALPGVAVENGEGNRVLLITSTRREGIGYPDRGGTFQYFNQVAVTRPMTKWSGAVTDRSRIGEFMRRAFRTSWSGRPGVVHVDIPESVMNGKDKTGGSQARPPATYRRTEPLEPDLASVRQAATMLAAARRPLIHSGTGVIHSGAFAQLQSVAEALGAPVTTSWGGRGALPETHPLAVPMPFVDLYTTLHNQADVVLVLGSRMGETDWWGKAPYWAPPETQRVIQVDIDDANIGLNKPIEVAVMADIARFLDHLGDALAAGPDITRQPDTWSSAKAQERAKLDKRLDKTGDRVHPGLVPRITQAGLPDDTIWVFDGGNTAVWSHFYHEARQTNSVITTFKFGMLGAGVAQALGAAVAAPGRPVCCLIGDGAMGFHPQEIETAVRNGLTVIYVVFADLAWGMVKMGQQFALKPVKTIVRKSLSEGETINADFSEIKFDDLAKAMGAHGERVSKADELEPALRRSIDSGKTAVIHVDVDPVTHMWAPALRTFKDMHLEPGG